MYDETLKTLFENKQYAEARDYCIAYVNSNGYSPDLGRRLGECYHCLNEPELAYEQLKFALSYTPTHAPTLMVMSGICGALNKIPEALEYAKQAEYYHPNFAQAAWNMSLYLLHLEQWELGFKYYKARRLTGQNPLRNILVKEGDPSLWEGKIIHVTGEQGFGDMFMFSRYIHYLIHDLKCKVIFECHSELSMVFEQDENLTIHHFDPYMGVPRQADYSVALLDIPFYLKDTLRDRDYSSLYKNPAIVLEQIKEQLSNTSLVGMTFNGRASHGNDINRSFTFSEVEELLSPIKFKVLDLNITPICGDLENHPKIDPVGKGIGNWLVTSVILRALNRLISVDTAIVHLSLALGLPTTVILPYAEEWRWGYKRTSSPWYKEGLVKYIKQSEIRNWSSVYKEIRKEINTYGNKN